MGAGFGDVTAEKQICGRGGRVRVTNKKREVQT